MMGQVRGKKHKSIAVIPEVDLSRLNAETITRQSSVLALLLVRFHMTRETARGHDRGIITQLYVPPRRLY